jgi:hypothetical protein
MDALLREALMTSVVAQKLNWLREASDSRIEL